MESIQLGLMTAFAQGNESMTATNCMNLIKISVVVVVLLPNGHDQQLWSCRDGRLT